MQANESPVSPPCLCLRILLSEDRATGGTRLARMLVKLGHSVTKAAGDKDALTRSMHGHFDLVLIAIHMCDMDGLTAVTAIREQEKVLGGHVSIIAMSDQTGKVDRKRCLAAGMDRYTTKPRNTTELETILLAFSDPDSVPRLKRPANWNRTAVLERAGGDEQTLNELLEIFVKEQPHLMAELNRALLTAQAEMLERTAFKLAEDLSYLGAPALARTARELALVAKRRDFLKARSLVSGLQSQLFEVTAIMSGASL